MYAVRLGSVFRSDCHTAQNVGSTGYNFHMARVYALPVTTKMINLQAGWYGTNQQMIGQAVGEHWLPPRKGKFPIPSHRLCLPRPAIQRAAHENFCPEARYHEGRDWIRKVNGSHVAHYTTSGASIP